MAWEEQRSRKRILELQEKSAPAAISVRDLERFLGERARLRETVMARGERFDEPIFAIPMNAAVITKGVHVYANLMDHRDHMMVRERQSESSDARSLQFLHSHYSACDELIAEFGIQRVDYHGGRLHAVVLTPMGDENEQVRIENAIAFAAAYRDMVQRMAAADRDAPSTRVRVGIDSGLAVAINSGRSHEKEPLFVGSPANHAAKAADGDVPGIFFGPGITHRRQIAKALGSARVAFADAVDLSEERAALDRDVASDGHDQRASARLERAYRSFEQRRLVEAASPAVFRFHFHEPPLRTIRFKDHPPSNSIRMAMASTFADIAGFTAYIDKAVLDSQVAQAVSNLMVMRGEMHFVARDDFGSRKVRYIGDCLQSVHAEGDARNVDEKATVKKAVLAGSGIYSSFELCREILPCVEDLGIAIGIELGVTPLSRLGLRGDASVRCVSSRSTCVSEEVQSHCGPGEIGLGPDAYDAADASVKRLFGTRSRVVRCPRYGSTAALLLGAPAIVSSTSAAAATPLRAYGR